MQLGIMGWGAHITPLYFSDQAHTNPGEMGGSEMAWVLLKEEGTSRATPLPGTSPSQLWACAVCGDSLLGAPGLAQYPLHIRSHLATCTFPRCKLL